MRSRNDHARTRARVTAAIAAALFLGACSKGEPEKTQVRPAAPAAPVAAAPASAAPPAGDYVPSEALKERLARQEAAARMVDPPSPPPAPARAAERPQAPAGAPAPVKPAQPPPAAPVAAARTAPSKAIEPAPSPPPPAAAKAEPPKATPQPAPRTEVAIAKPQPVPAPVATKLVQRVEPEFPREALQAGEEQGLVQARLTLDERGNVTRVEVVEAHPRRLFDRSVIRALSQWKYNDGAAGRTVEIEIAFKR